MLFQGQEFAASAPFLYFADHEPELAQPVRERARGVPARSFRASATVRTRAARPDPGDPRDVRALQARLRASARRTRDVYALHRDLLRLRRDDPRSRAGSAAARRRRGPRRRRRSCCASSGRRPADDRLLLVNLGRDLDLRSFAGAAARAAGGCGWDVPWSSEDPRTAAAARRTVGRDGAVVPARRVPLFCRSSRRAELPADASERAPAHEHERTRPRLTRLTDAPHRLARPGADDRSRSSRASGW